MNAFSQMMVGIVLTVCLLSGASPAALGAGSDAGTLMQPLQAWTVAPDGAVFVLDAAHVIHQLDSATLTSVRRSAPLADGFSGRPAFMLATEGDLWIGSNALGETRRLARNTFEPLSSVNAVGPLALDPDVELFVIQDRGIFAYDLSGSSAAPRVVISPWAENQFIGDLPLHMLIDPDTRQLYVTYYGNYGSPPHNREYLVAFDLDTLEKTPLGKYLAHLSPPAFAANTGQVATVLNAKNGLDGSRLLIFEPGGENVEEIPYLQGEAVLDPDGQWVYVLRSGGLWVLRSSDMALVSILPILDQPPAGMLLSPDGAFLYLFGNGWATSLPTAYLQELGLPNFAPLSPAWRNDSLPYHLFAPFGYDEHGIAFTLGSNGEIYRSADGAQTWRLIVPSLYPQPRWFSHLSISPEFAQDGVLVARSAREDSLYRSADAGLTWQPWMPRLAFTSDRDGNREIYTADTQGNDIRRLTNHPGIDENPAWSPGWTRVLFQSDRNGNFDIYSARAGCVPDAADAETLCDLQRLTDDPADDLLPAWSPDGTRIAFVSLRDGNAEIYQLEQDGSNLRRLTYNRTGDWRPAWSPDGHHILFTSDRNGDNDIFRIRAPAPGSDWDPGVEDLVKPVIATAADERDATLNASGDLLLLSDHAGEMAVWRFYSSNLTSYDAEDTLYRPYKRISTLGRHPAWLDVGGTPGLFMAVEKTDNSDIVHLATPSAEETVPIITSPAFDGHPAAGSVWWDSSVALP